MRLITHNMLKCNIRGVENGYPLKIVAEKVETIPVEIDKGKLALHFLDPSNSIRVNAV